MFCIDILKFTARRKIFTERGEKSLAVGELVRTRTRLGAKRPTLYFLNFNIKNENFKILNPSTDG
jgi:hypothetical protein